MKIGRAPSAVASLFAMLCFATIPCSAHALDAASAGSAVHDAAATATASYRLNVRLDPATRELAGEAEITVSDGAPFDLLLNRRFGVDMLAVDGKPVVVRLQRNGELNRIALPPGPRRKTVKLAWRGPLAPLAALEHRDTLRAHEPTADALGSFLPSAGVWYPAASRRGQRLLHSYNLRLDLPPGQRGLVAGHRGTEATRGSRTVAEFAFPHPSEGIDLIAGPYRVAERTARSIDGRPIMLRTYFHAELDPLAPGYLDAVADYLALYERWIGPYPFTTFSVVSSPTPTGFGMPTLTYLGIEVLKLPFIKSTSLGHEVLHNWWGNGVYPDYEAGNWSEGLTTFMADYHYAERESSDKAHAMRLAWLRELSGIPPGADRPLAAFTARTHGVDQAIGYGKAAMLFLMLRDRIGEPAFDRGIRRFWQAQRFRNADWDDLRVAFETESGQQLDRFFEQWLARAGLAEVALVESRRCENRVAVTLRQGEQPYAIEVPLAIGTTGGEAVRRVRLDRSEQRFELELAAADPATRVTLDPDNRLLRRLHGSEAPPILRELQFDARSGLVALGDDAFATAAGGLAARMLDHSPQAVPPGSAPGEHPLLVIGEARAVSAWLARHGLPPAPPEVAGRGAVRVWTQRLPSGAPLAVVAADSAPELVAASRPLPHYRQQSWLVLQNGRALARGVWPAEASSIPVTHCPAGSLR
ncbi:M1 family metallopeptidase [Aromatoleum sp.]|uniref:M1 family metallopeptidase n=1 Tax=Aromatoleum sp. TaxID=2307007 RepID=UPI002FCA1E14